MYQQYVRWHLDFLSPQSLFMFAILFLTSQLYLFLMGEAILKEYLQFLESGFCLSKCFIVGVMVDDLLYFWSRFCPVNNDDDVIVDVSELNLFEQWCLIAKVASYLSQKIPWQTWSFLDFRVLTSSYLQKAQLFRYEWSAFMIRILYFSYHFEVSF